MEILIGTKEPWCVDSDRDDVPRNEDNICWKAAKLFFERIGEDPDGLTVHILKRLFRHLIDSVIGCTVKYSINLFLKRFLLLFILINLLLILRAYGSKNNQR